MDHMQIGDLLPLPGGWYYDTNAKKKFRFDEDGNAIDENGNVIRKAKSEETDVS